MSKYIKRMKTQKERYLIVMNILSLKMDVTEDVDKIIIEWRRGNKKSVTRDFYRLSTLNQVTDVGEIFKKLSVFYKDEKKGVFMKKNVLMKLTGCVKNKVKSLGHVQFDLSGLVGSLEFEKILTLDHCPYANSEMRINISIIKDSGTIGDANFSSDEEKKMGSEINFQSPDDSIYQSRPSSEPIGFQFYL